MKKILLIFTGGTICSCANGVGSKNQSNAKKTASLLEENYKSSDSPFAGEVEFVSKFLSQDILSENMTVDSWEEILGIFRDGELTSDREGVIILHGTDTLAYTASFLSLALAGFERPVLMVSSQLDLNDSKTNGYLNFKAAVELIMNGILPNVYAVYQNVRWGTHETEELLLHYGADLLQCRNFSNSFHSYGEQRIPDLKNAALSGMPFETGEGYFSRVDKLVGKAVIIQPYTNLDYSRIDLKDCLAVIHGTYHSYSVCIGRADDPTAYKNRDITLPLVKKEDRPYSILTLLEECEKKDIPLFLAPCDGENYAYGTTKNALSMGAAAVSDMTLETAYAKAILGLSLGKRGDGLKEFMKKSINREAIQKK